ncbi:MAG: hypothetical protein MUE81_20390 [Thermoflexibacter sp.]|jgi:GTPase SAR1 family protein|nr:hypothetical protein [Thermoflexibacter sp.]
MITSWLYQNNKKLVNRDLTQTLDEARAKKVEFLDLSNNKFTQFSYVGEPLPDLKVLDMSYNQVPIEEFVLSSEAFPHLECLFLHSSLIKQLEIFGTFPRLRTIDVSQNQLTTFSLALSDSNHFPCMESLYLYGNPISNLPKEVFDKNAENQNVWGEEIKNFFQAITEDGKIPNDQIKLLVLGNSTVGKSSLIHFLKEGIYEKSKASTHGIDNLIWQPYKQDEQASEFEKSLNVSVWDFGGQEFYHNTHALFFSDNALYLVLFETDTNFQGQKLTELYLYEKGEKVLKTIPLEHFNHAYWLDNIAHISPQKQLPTLLVQNKCDISSVLNIDDCKSEYGIQEEHIFRISVEKTYEKERKHERNFEAFKETLLDIIKGSIAKFENSKKWQEIKNQIQSAWAKENILSYQEYQKRCQAIKPTIADKREGQEESQLDTLTKILHEKGVLLHFKHITELKEFIFVNPAWLTDSIYKVLDYSVIHQKGEFTFEHIEQVAEKIGGMNAAQMLALLKDFKLIFEIEKDEERLFIAPQYLPEQFDKATKGFVDSFEQTNNIKDCFTIAYDFLPVSVFLKFLAIYGNRHYKYWYNKNQLVFIKSKKVVFAQCVRNSEKRQISIKIQDGDLGLAKELFEALLSIDNTEKLQISLDNQNFVYYQKLKAMQEKGFVEIESLQGNRLKISSFSFLFGIHNPIQTPQNSFEETKTRILNAIENADLAKAFELIDSLKTEYLKTELEILRKEIIINGLRDANYIDRLKIWVSGLRD